MKTLKAKEPVWFGCDCSKMMHRDLSVWDARMFDFENLYGAPLELESIEIKTIRPELWVSDSQVKEKKSWLLH